ncbi:MAG: hypothetical protein PHZ04_01815 [Patescibacteria group bacterium]|nr:hypothetical protein [Patescibacteria group bacterium]MDD5554802.1 hypothetical protein [Patescibacteria group bacterium]
MTEEKWENIKGQIKDSFKVEDEGKEHQDERGGVDTEYIIFEGPLGRMKLEFITKPVVLDKKTNYSNRIGSETKVNYVYSESEKTNRLVAYKWEESRDDWTEIEAGMFEN